jgi:hypothetical protein
MQNVKLALLHFAFCIEAEYGRRVNAKCKMQNVKLALLHFAFCILH